MIHGTTRRSGRLPNWQEDENGNLVPLNGEDIGVYGGDRPGTVYADRFEGSHSVYGKSYFRRSDLSLGDGSCYGLDILDTPLRLSQRNLADGAGVYAINSIWDVNAASCAGYLHSFGFTDDNDDLQRVFLVHGSGSIQIGGDKGAGDTGFLTLTNVLAAADDTAHVSFGDSPFSGDAGVFAGWIKVYAEDEAVYVPAIKATS